MQGSYVWGLDGSPGTVISDYIVFGLCFVYGVCILHLYKSTRYSHSNGLHRRSDIKFQVYSPDKEKARKLLLVLTANFLFCAAMNVIGALLHHFVPLVEPVSLPRPHVEPDEFDLFQLMLLKLFPWVLVWQLANVSAVLYGIGIFLTVLYTIDYHMSSKYFTCQNGGLQSGNSTFNFVKKILVAIASITVFFHGVSRIHRIFQFRSVMFQKSTTSLTEADFHSAKLNLDQFGWMWSATSATIIMFSAFFVNALITLYMFIAAMRAKMYGIIHFGGTKTSFIRTLGAWMLFIGGVIQILWAGSCASNAPNDCPFPLWFNHNACYHSLQGLGMTSWFLAEWTYFNKVKSTISKND